MELSIVIPAYNEEKRIGATLKGLFDFIKTYKKIKNYEIIIIDDGSKDNTLKVIPKNKNISILKNKTNRGKGYSVRKGVLNSKYALILFMDGDLATPMDELDKLYSCIRKGYDIAIASRCLKDSTIIVEQPKYRQFAGKLFPFIVNLIMSLEFKDTQCGFKLMKADPAKKIFTRLTIDRWAFDVEMLYIAKKLGYRIAEVPVTWIDKTGSKLNVFKDPFKMFSDLFRIRLRDLFGRYNT